MNASIKPERKALLEDKYFEFSFNGKQLDKQFFDNIDNSLEYHYIASIYNWDDGVEVLSWIINSKICDAGTAKMIFWRAQPSYYTRFLTKQEASSDGEVFELLRVIVKNFQDGIYSNQSIAYDPVNDPAAEETDYVDPKAKWEIPAFMKEPSLGREVDF